MREDGGAHQAVVPVDCVHADEKRNLEASQGCRTESGVREVGREGGWEGDSYDEDAPLDCCACG